ncbi:MAG: nickel-dependent hydrogenase large subunit [Coriobacteriia bacterium]|nr:nickel-dependent hydrogenase large subunit [Coriobacteriia bacterium]
MAKTRTLIDPVTRIEGHLRIELEVENDKVTDAWVSGTLFRGLELIMKGRAPQDAFFISQRICGVCPVSHGHTSTMATDKAFNIAIPNNARIIRNLIEGAQFLHSHILWFYQLAALDWIDASKALKANVADTHALAEKAGTSGADFGAVQKHLKALVDGGQMSIFSGAWFGNDAYAKKMPPELNLIAVAHYLEALHMQSEASAVAAIMGGKMPHIMTSIPGGTTFVPTEEKLDGILFRLLKVRDWVQNTMIPDTLAIAPFYPEALGYGQGVGKFLAYGVFEAKSMKASDRYLPPGVIRSGLKVEDVDQSKILEFVDSSFYEAQDGNKNPAVGSTHPIAPVYDTEKSGGKYSWSKSPRYDGVPLEVGGLSRMLVAYLRGVPRVKELVDGALKALGAAGKPEVLVSTLGRVAGRNLEALYVGELMIDQVNELIANLKGGDSKFFQSYNDDQGAGVGMWEAPRGALLHATNVKNHKIENYQCIVPSTWNISPRTKDGVRGPMEQALIGNPCTNLKQPLEALRTVHSFDPCIACAVHVTSVKTGAETTIWTGPAMGVR